MWLSAEVNTVLLSGMIAIFGALATWAVAFLRVKTRQLNDMAERTKEMANANHEILVKNTELTKSIQRQTDGLTKKMTEIAAAAAFTRGRVVGREEGASKEEYEDLYKLEEEIGVILDLDKIKPKP